MSEKGKEGPFALGADGIIRFCGVTVSHEIQGALVGGDTVDGYHRLLADWLSSHGWAGPDEIRDEFGTKNIKHAGEALDIAMKECVEWRESARAESLAADEARKTAAESKERAEVWKKFGEASTNQFNQLDSLYEESKKDAERLAVILGDLGRHDDSCLLSQWSQGRPMKGGGYEEMYGGVWYQVKPENKRPKCVCGLDAALAAHDSMKGESSKPI